MDPEETADVDDVEDAGLSRPVHVTAHTARRDQGRQSHRRHARARPRELTGGASLVSSDHAVSIALPDLRGKVDKRDTAV